MKRITLIVSLLLLSLFSLSFVTLSQESCDCCPAMTYEMQADCEMCQLTQSDTDTAFTDSVSPQVVLETGIVPVVSKVFLGIPRHDRDSLHVAQEGSPRLSFLSSVRMLC